MKTESSLSALRCQRFFSQSPKFFRILPALQAEKVLLCLSQTAVKPFLATGAVCNERVCQPFPTANLRPRAGQGDAAPVAGPYPEALRIDPASAGR